MGHWALRLALALTFAVTSLHASATAEQKPQGPPQPEAPPRAPPAQARPASGPGFPGSQGADGSQEGGDNADPAEENDSDAGKGGLAAVGGCSVGAKAIFVDLGNAPFRDPEFAGLPAPGPGEAPLRPGGTLSSASWEVGCIDEGTMEVVRSPVREGEAVRLVLLNARADVDYYFATSGREPDGGSASKDAKLFSPAAPECGDAGKECHVDTAGLKTMQAEASREARTFAELSKRRTDASLAAFAAAISECADGRWMADTCDALPGLAAPAPLPEWWSEVSAAAGSIRGRVGAIKAMRTALCENWLERLTTFDKDYSSAEQERVSKIALPWTERVIKAALTASSVRATIRGLRALDDLDLVSPKGRKGTGAAILRDIISAHYYQDNYAELCVGAPARESGKKFERKALSGVTSRVARSYRYALALLNHAAATKVFTLDPAEANTEVAISVQAAPRGDRATDPQARPELLKLAFSVEGAPRFGFSIGTAVALHGERGSGKTEVSPPPKPLLFLNWRLWEPRRCPMAGAGMQVGIALDSATALAKDEKPDKVDLYVGAVFWPVSQLAIGLGVVDAVQGSATTQLGGYVGVTADIGALLDLWKGPKQILAK